MATLIDPASIPGSDLDPDAVASAGQAMTTMGHRLAQQGGTLLRSWQQIAAHYEAPEDHELFAAMTPVGDHAETYGGNLVGADKAFDTFAETVRPIKVQLDQLRAEAGLFVESVKGGVVQHALVPGAGYAIETVNWSDSPAAVQAHNALLVGVAAQSAALEEAEAVCARRLNALSDVVESGSGRTGGGATLPVAPGGSGRVDRSWNGRAVPERCAQAAVDHHPGVSERRLGRWQPRRSGRARHSCRPQPEHRQLVRQR